MRRWNTLTGMITTSSWSLPMPDWPRLASTPMTGHETLPTRICWPVGSALPKSCDRTVSPMMQRDWPRSSAGVKVRPSVRFQSWATK